MKGVRLEAWAKNSYDLRMDVANLFTGLLWDFARDAPIDVVWKRKKKLLVTRHKKNVLFDALVFEHHVIQLLQVRRVWYQGTRQEDKMAIKERVAKIVCLFKDIEDITEFKYDVVRGHRPPEDVIRGVPQSEELVMRWDRQTKARIAKIQIIFRQSGADVIQGKPKKEDEFYLLHGSDAQQRYPANSSWINLESQWSRRELGTQCPVFTELEDFDDTDGSYLD